VVSFVSTEFSSRLPEKSLNLLLFAVWEERFFGGIGLFKVKKHNLQPPAR
jgi:hypothetical protein